LSGLDVAEARLYTGAPWVICPLPQADPAAAALVEALALAVGARPVYLKPARHDRLVAAISHLPYVLAAALFAAVDDVGQEDALAWQLAAGGFRSTTRLAGSDVTMMTDILLSNQANVLAMVDALRSQLDLLADLVRRGDERALRLATLRIRALREEFLERYGP